MDDDTFKKRCFYVAVTVIALFIAIAALWNISSILSATATVVSKLYYYVSPLIYAFLIAYFFYIPLGALEGCLRKHEKLARVRPTRMRTATLIITYAGFIALVVAIIISIYIMIGGQLSRNTDINQMLQYVVEYLSEYNLTGTGSSSASSLSDAMNSIKEWIENYLVKNVSNIGQTLSNISAKVVIIVVSIIISIYFLYDYENLVGRLRGAYHKTLGRVKCGQVLYGWIEIFNVTFKQFLRGQLFEACIVAAMSVVALWIAKVNYFVVIGVIAGICNLVPFIGPWIGAAVAVAVSLLGGSYVTAIWAVVAMIIVQQIDNHLVAPKVVGDSVGLHPVITMVMLIVGADIGGIFGMLVAVPFAASVKRIIDGQTAADLKEMKAADAPCADDGDAAVGNEQQG